jgi:hypothetical protein
VRVAHLPREAPRIGRQLRLPEHAGRDHGGAESAHGSVVQGNAPGSVGLPLEPLHRHTEPDGGAQPKGARIGVQVGGHLAVMREVAVLGRHRETRVLHAQAGDVRAERRVRRREAAVVLVAPEPAHVRAPLETLGRDTLLPQRLQDRKPRRPSPDYGHVRHWSRATHRPTRLAFLGPSESSLPSTRAATCPTASDGR